MKGSVTGGITGVQVEVKRRRRALCVLSGGMDSAVAAAAVQAQGYEIESLFIAYGQRAERMEYQAADAITSRLHGTMHTAILPLNDLPSALFSDEPLPPLKNKNRTPDTWVPCRNLVLVSLAAAYAEALGAEIIVTGFNAEEAVYYPDNGIEFIKAMNEVLKHAVAIQSTPPRLVCPLTKYKKPDIVRLGVRLNVPFELTYSCYTGDDHHCGCCESCLRRIRGFKEAGLDPVMP